MTFGFWLGVLFRVAGGRTKSAPSRHCWGLAALDRRPHFALDWFQTKPGGLGTLDKIARLGVLMALSLAILFVSPHVRVARGDDDSNAQALAAVDRFMAAFNSADMTAWAKTLNYPHVRIASDTVKVSQTPEEYASSFDFDVLRDRYGWDHSAWDYKKVVQSSRNKVHVAVQFTRYRADDSRIATYQAIYVVTNKDGHWGVQARSSFAP